MLSTVWLASCQADPKCLVLPTCLAGDSEMQPGTTCDAGDDCYERSVCGETVLCKPTRVLSSGICIRNADDSCTSDADCKAGGCGGELCYNPKLSNGASDCDCTSPQNTYCGCVKGKCAWWQAPQAQP